MASRRCLHTLNRRYTSVLSSSNPSLQSLKTLNPTLQHTQTPLNPLPSQSLPSKSHHIFANLRPICYPQYTATCHFSSHRRDDSKEEEEDDDDEEGCDDESDLASNCGGVKREYTAEEEEEAAAIGYKVVGPLQRSDHVFNPYQPVFAVVQIGSHQFKVSNGDCIYAERLKFCEVNDKLILNRVLMLGSRTQTIIGRPILPDAAVHAVVEEHAIANAKFATTMEQATPILPPNQPLPIGATLLWRLHRYH